MVKEFNQQFRVGQGGLVEANADLTLDSGSFLILVDATAGPVTVTLQRADGLGGKRYCIKKIDSSINAVTISPALAQTIDGLASVTLTLLDEPLEIISDNENWLKLVKPGAWSVIEKFEVIDPLGINSKTFNFAPIDFEDDSMLVLIADFSLTAGSGAFTFTVNGITGGWVSDGRRIINGVETIIDEPGISQGARLVTDALLTSSSIPVHLIAYIQLNKVGTADRVGVQSFANGVLITGNENISHTNTANITSISSITMTGRIRNFQTGSRITLYKVSRI